MAKPTKKSTLRLSASPPGILGFAEGGKPETADELMARIAGKYGVTGQRPTALVQQPAPQPQPKAQALPQQQGVVGILRGRKEAIDKAVNGYAEGGEISGPGTPTSDSIDARVHETAEPIKVSTEERIVSKAQGQFLEDVAKNAGFDSLDAMLEFGTGKPVGPTIKAGKRAAEDGLSPENDPFAYRGAPVAQPQTGSEVGRVDAATEAVPTLGSAQFGRTSPAGILTGPASGITVDHFGPIQKVGSGLASQNGKSIDAQFMTGKTPGVAPELFQQAGRDPSGIITAESASGAMGNDMQRSGGVFGSIDMKGANEIMARENKIRGEMIDNSIKANGGAGFNTLPDHTNDANIEQVLNKLSPAERAKFELGKMSNDAAIAQQGITSRGQDLDFQRGIDRNDTIARGQDLGLQRSQERNQVMTRGQDVRADTSADRITSNEAIAGARINERGGASLAQQRSNAEIDAARQTIAGLSADDIRRKTAKTTNTGRENPDYDPQLERAASLANRRRVGDDSVFDQRLQPQQPQQPVTNEHGYDRTDVAKRFREERAMDRHKLGKDTPNGVEVLDASGKVIGHYN